MRVVRSALILLACLSATVFAHERRPSIYSALHRCPLHALATNDNDIRLDMDPRPKGWKVPLPASVAEAIYRNSSKDLESAHDRELIDWATSHCGDTLGDVYRLAVPGGHQIFVARVYEPAAADIFHLILYDPLNRKISRNPLWLSAKWTEEFGFDNGLAEPPVFRFDQNEEGTKRLVFSEYQHDGNVYNAIINRYFELGPDLSLTQVMAIEKVSTEPDTDDLIVRRAREVTPTRIDVSVYEKPEKGPDHKLGSYRLVRDRAGQPYRVVDRSVVASGHDWLKTLVDGCHGFDEGDESMAADDKFQRVGCDFYY